MSKRAVEFNELLNSSNTSTPSRPRRSKLPKYGRSTNFGNSQFKPVTPSKAETALTSMENLPPSSISASSKLCSDKPKPKILLEDFDDNFDDDIMFDDNFDTSLLETSMEKLSQPPSSMPGGDPWARLESSQEALDERKYPLPDDQMNQFMKIKGLSKGLYTWQDDCLRLKKVINGSNLVFSLPTSAGKSLVAEVHLLRHLLEGKNCLLVLPFVSIVQEKVASLSQLATETGQKFVVEEYAAGNGRIPPIRRRQTPALFIATIEKASQIINCAINRNGPWISCCVVDELHMIGDGIRGARLESAVAKLLFSIRQGKGNCQVVGMSATLPNLSDIVRFMRAELFTSDFRPIPLTQYLKLNNFVYRIDDAKNQLITKYDRQIKPINGAMDPDGLLPLVLEVIPDHSVLIFCSSRRNCQSVMKLLSRQLTTQQISDELAMKREKLVSDLKEELESVGGIDEDFLNSLLCGIAFHHAGLSGPERATIEEGFRDGTLCVLCCTSTLAAGVNLPARRVIIRALTQGRSMLPISTYRQMAGRAGRAGYDTMGEAFIIAPPKERKRCLELVGGAMNNAESQLEKLIYEAILSVLELNLALTKTELMEFFTKFTLVGLQRGENSNFCQLIENTLDQLTELNVIVAKDARVGGVIIEDEIDFLITPIGRASVGSGIDLKYCSNIWKRLDKAMLDLNLKNTLQLTSLAISEEILEQFKYLRLDWDIYYEELESLEDHEFHAMELICGVKAAQLGDTKRINSTRLIQMQAPTGKMDQTERETFFIGYLVLVLRRIAAGDHHALVGRKFAIDRGEIQSLFTAVVSECARLSTFCNHIDAKMGFFSALFDKLIIQLSYSSTPDLIDLLLIPGVKIGRARQLYAAGFTTIVDVAKSSEEEIFQRLEKINPKQARTLVSAAKNLLQKLDEARRNQRTRIESFGSQQAAS